MESNEQIKYGLADLPVEVPIGKPKESSESFYVFITAIGGLLLVIGGGMLLLDFIAGLSQGELQLGSHLSRFMVILGVPLTMLGLTQKQSNELNSKIYFESELDQLLDFSREELPDGKQLVFDLVQIRKSDDIYRIRLVDSADIAT